MAEPLDELARDLRDKGEEVRREAVAVVNRGALNVKNDWQRLFRADERHGYAAAYPYSISYDSLAAGGRIRAEIGPDKGRRQGALGNLIEFGSVHNAPGNHGGRALEIEEPRFTEEIARLGGEL